MRDRDGAFSQAFDEALSRKRVHVIQTPFRAPNTNAYAERFVQSIKQECLDHFLVFGLRHLNHLCQEYLAFYLSERPHQAKDNELLTRPKRRGRAAESSRCVCSTLSASAIRSRRSPFVPSGSSANALSGKLSRWTQAPGRFAAFDAEAYAAACSDI